MRMAVELDDGRGIAVVAKRADTEAEAGRLAREAELLETLHHPGLVELVDVAPGELSTRFSGGGSLETVGRPDPARAAALIAAIATTVADLHDLGVAHRRLDATHVVIDDHGRPLLCGLAEATAANRDTKAADVAELGHLLSALLGDGVELEPIPERPFAGWRRGSGEGVRRALLNLADQASADDPAHRPSARRFAAALRDTCPDAGLDERSTPVDQEVSPLRLASLRRSLAPVASAKAARLATVGVGALAAVVALWALRPAGGSPSTAAPATSADRAAPTTATVTADVPDRATALPAAGCQTLGGDGPRADLDGDGCPGPLTLTGNVVSGERIRFQVGDPGDLVTLGDWDCDGDATPSLLRPGTGEVFVFDHWPGAGDLVARPIAVVTDGRRVQANPTPGASADPACAEVAVELADGSSVTVWPVAGNHG